MNPSEKLPQNIENQTLFDDPTPDETPVSIEDVATQIARATEGKDPYAEQKDRAERLVEVRGDEDLGRDYGRPTIDRSKSVVHTTYVPFITKVKKPEEVVETPTRTHSNGPGIVRKSELGLDDMTEEEITKVRENIARARAIVDGSRDLDKK